MTPQATRATDSTSLRFRRAAGRFPTGVAVVSTVNDATPHAMTVNSFVTVSLEPLMVLVSLGLTMFADSRYVVCPPSPVPSVTGAAKPPVPSPR